MLGRLVLINGDVMMYVDWRGEEYDIEVVFLIYDIMVKEFYEME